MTWTIDASGTATGGSEQVLDAQNTPATYVLAVDLSAMQLGDVVILRVYTMLDGVNYRVAWQGTYQHVQSSPGVISPPLTVVGQAKWTLQQSAGTGRSFPWQVRRNQGQTLTWTPASLNNLVGWYDADPSHITLSSGNVTVVQDLSGNGNNLVNSGTVPWLANSAFNSRSAFNFIAANDACLKAFGVMLPATGALSLYLVGQMRSPTVAYGGAVSVGIGSGPDFNVSGNISLLTRTAGLNQIETYYDALANAEVDTSISLSTNYRIGVVVSGSSPTKHYINGGTPNPSPGTYTFGPLTTPTNIIIGNRWGGSGTITGSAWDGPILAVVLAATAFSINDIANLDAWATNKWGI